MNKQIKSSQRWIAADGVRGLACLIVLLTHAIALFFPETELLLAGIPKTGVWLFFVLSAFLLSSRLYGDGFSFRVIIKYLLGRIFRILPLFLITVFIYRLIRSGGLSTWQNVGEAIFFRKAFSHLWTIPVEFIFYLWLPFIVYGLGYVRKNFGFRASVFAFLFLIIIQQAIWPYWKTTINTLDSLWYSSCFSCGVFIGICMQDLQKFVTPQRSNIFAILFLLGLFFASPGIRYFLFSVPYSTALANKFLFIGIAWAVFIVFTLNEAGWPGLMVKNRFFVEVGRRSYSIYLFHWIIYEKLSNLFHHNFSMMVVGFILAIAFGHVVYVRAEKPLEKWRQRIMSRFDSIPG